MVSVQTTHVMKCLWYVSTIQHTPNPKVRPTFGHVVGQVHIRIITFIISFAIYKYKAMMTEQR